MPLAGRRSALALGLRAVQAAFEVVAASDDEDEDEDEDEDDSEEDESDEEDDSADFDEESDLPSAESFNSRARLRDP
jgi:hypothetical protein